MIRLQRFRALTFDCYGTLIDWEAGILAALAGWRARHRLEVADDALLEAYGDAETRLERVRPVLAYPEVLRRALAAMGEAFGAPPTAAECDAFARSIGDWPPFPDSAPALRDLKARYRLAILSNVDRASLVATLDRLAVAPDLVVTAEDVGAYKPDRPHFARALALLGDMGIAKDEVLHVAQSRFHDIAPARGLGLATVWVDRRRGRPGEGIVAPAGAEPDLRVASLAELVDLDRAGRCARPG